MLQINTGKLFKRGVERTNSLIGVLYTNARLPYERDIKTTAGSLRSTGSGTADLAVVYELEERIEEGPDGPSALLSHTAKPYLDDFAIVASFGLGAVFSRDPGVVRSLTDGRPTFGHSSSPATYISRFFEPTVYLTDDDVDDFERFVTDLLALERKSFLGVMQAMRTFVGGLHRISDNLGQAYTMMVSAVESLAQDFDAFVPQWEDLDHGKRKPIDDAISGMDPVVIDGVRLAILSKEHVALSRRYRAFTLSHVDDAFFRETAGGGRPIARYELEPAVRKSYDLRSAYIHLLRGLPTAISHPHGHWETTSVERMPALTFQGLYRVTRQVIRSFVSLQPKTEDEEYEYGLERAGVIRMELAPQYWIWKPIADPAEVPRRLEGLVSMVVSVFRREPGAELVDMRNALADVERLLPQARRDMRSPMLSLHFLFNLVLAPDLRSVGFDAFFEKHGKEAGQPSIDTIVVATLLDAADEWTTETYADWLDRYFAQRVRKGGFHAPRLVEAAMCLTLADKFRRQGQFDDAQGQIIRAFEVDPGNATLRELLTRDPQSNIDWRKMLLPIDGEAGESDVAEDAS